MKGHKRTTLIQMRDGDGWRMLEDRVDMEHLSDMPPDVFRSLTFAERPRTTTHGVAFNCTAMLDHFNDSIGTMNKRDKRVWHDGLAQCKFCTMLSMRASMHKNFHWNAARPVQSFWSARLMVQNMISSSS